MKSGRQIKIFAVDLSALICQFAAFNTDLRVGGTESPQIVRIWRQTKKYTKWQQIVFIKIFSVEYSSECWPLFPGITINILKTIMNTKHEH